MMIVPFAQIACYRTVTTTFLIVTVNIKYHIIVPIARDFAFQTSIVSAEFGYSRLCWVNCSLCFIAWVRLGLENVQFSNFSIANSTRIFDLNSALGTCTGTHILVEVVTFLQLPNSYCIMSSAIQSFSILCNQHPAY